MRELISAFPLQRRLGWEAKEARSLIQHKAALLGTVAFIASVSIILPTQVSAQSFGGRGGGPGGGPGGSVGVSGFAATAAGSGGGGGGAGLTDGGAGLGSGGDGGAGGLNGFEGDVTTFVPNTAYTGDPGENGNTGTLTGGLTSAESGGGGGGGSGGYGAILTGSGSFNANAFLTGGSGGNGGEAAYNYTGYGYGYGYGPASYAGGRGGDGGVGVSVAAGAVLTLSATAGAKGGIGGSGGNASYTDSSGYGYGYGYGNASSAFGGAGGRGGAGIVVLAGAKIVNLGGMVIGGDGGVGGSADAFDELGTGTGGDGGAGGAGITVVSSGNIMNSGTIQGGQGGEGAFADGGATVFGRSGDGGSGVQGVGASVTNLADGSILGGQGGISETTFSGVGGAGISLTNGSIANNLGATIQGGIGGGVGAVGPAGIGGAGISASETTITNEGSIRGGDGGGSTGSEREGRFVAAAVSNPPDADTAGGAGIIGEGLTIVNGGTIGGGLSGSNLPPTNAIVFTGGVNSLTLEATSQITGNVLAFSASDTLALGGTADQTFDVSSIGASASTAQYQGFGVFQKTGSSTWTLSNTTSAVTPWQVLDGILRIGDDTNLGNASGGVTLNGGALETTASFASARAFTIGTAGGAIITDATTNLTLSGVLSDAGRLTKEGAGTLTLTNVNTYSGGTTITAGTLVGSATSFGSGAIVDNAALTFDQATTAKFGNGISGTGTVTKTGVGTLNLNTANIYQGGTFLDTGTLEISDAGALGSGKLTMADGTTLALLGSFTVANAIDLAVAGDPVIDTGSNNDTLSGPISGPGALTKIGTGKLTLTGLNTYLGGTTVSAGTVIGSATSFGSGGIQNDAALVLDQSTTASFANAISGSGNFTKSGAGVLDLTGISSYSGASSITAGTLLVDGSVLNSIFSVGSGSSFGGSGTVGGLIALSGSTIAPGAGTPYSTLNVAGNLTFQAGSNFDVQINGAGKTDAINATGTATINGGTVNVLAGSGTYSTTSTYTLITAAGVTGKFAGTTATSNLAFLAPVLTYGPTQVVLTFTPATVVVPPSGGGTAAPPSTPTPAQPPSTSPAPPTSGPQAGSPVGTPVGPASPGTPTGSSAPAGTPPAAPPSNPAPVVIPVTFASVAATQNQRVTAVILQGLGGGNPLFDTVMSQSIAGARQAFTAVSGEAHASATTAAITDAHFVSTAIFDRLWNIGGSGLDAYQVLQGFGAGNLPTLVRCYGPTDAAIPPNPSSYSVWGQAIGEFGHNGGNGNAGSLDRQLGGFIVGIDVPVYGALADVWRFGFAAGYTSDSFDTKNRGGSGTYESAFGSLYGGARFGAVDLRFGTGYGSNSTGMHRTVAFPGFLELERSSYGGETIQGFGEIGYRFAFGETVIEPIAGFTAVHVHQDSFRENGGAAALLGFGHDTDVQTTTLGFRAEAAPFAGLPVVVRGMLGWQHAFGDLDPEAVLALRSGSLPFTVEGAPIDRDGAVGQVALDYRATTNLTIGLSYSGEVGSRAYENGVKGRMDYRF